MEERPQLIITFRLKLVVIALYTRMSELSEYIA